MKTYLCIGALVLLTGATAFAQPARRAPGTLALLNQRVPEVSMTETPLEQVMDWLTDFTQLNIIVRWQNLTDAGIERDAPISMQARNLRLSQVLWLIMNEAGGSEVKLAYRASGRLLIFSTEEDLNREMVTKIYDVSDLLLVLPRARQDQGFDVTQGLGQGGGGGGGGGMFGQGNQQQDQGQDQDYDADGMGGPMMRQLVDLIQQTVEPYSWVENGGLGTIHAFQRQLIVRNTLLVHQRLGGYVREEEVAGP
ncbi:MAG: hypothetical protein IPM18_00520 [Phycisphaerales bacterium]|nr:hypothetical protein [Phycisphaerales bacterium]